jgi:PAS domain S-box-containing protein
MTGRDTGPDVTGRNVTGGETGRPGGLRRALRSVRVQMALLTVVLALLIGLAVSLLIVVGYRTYKRSTELQLTETATALSLAVDGKVRESAGVLKTLALSPQLAANDIQGFDRMARRTVEAPDRWVILLDGQGRRLVDTGVPPGVYLPPAPTALFRSFQEKGAGTDLYVSDLTPSAVTGRLVVGLFIPVSQPGQPIRYLEIVLVPKVLQQVFAEQNLPEGWYGSLHDRQTRVIVRSFHSDRYLGRRSSVLVRVEPDARGVFPGRSLEGAPVLTAYKRSAFTGWILTVSMPQAAAQAALARSLALTLALVLGLLLLGWSLVWWLGGRYAAAIGRLAHAATSLGQGEPITHTVTGLSEIDAVGWAMHEAFASLRRREAEAREFEAKIRRLVEANIIGIFFWSLDGGVTDANDAFLALVGYDREDLRSGRIRWTDMTPPEWLEADRGAIDQVRSKGFAQPFEKEFFRKDGRRVPVLVGPAAFSGTRDEGVAFVLDLTEQKEAEQRLQLMVNELNHRVKNTLATVLAISAQSKRTAKSPEAFHQDLQGRLVALSQTHNLLNQTFWAGVGLRDLVDQELAPHADQEGRVVIEGEAVRLGPVSAVMVGMAIHELASNAAKYGALSTPAGQVRVSWRVDPPGRLKLIWAEAGGPPVQAPSRRGFGSELIEKVLAADLRGAVRLEFPPQGLRCTMDMALARASVH